jgi:hypothetical protein
VEALPALATIAGAQCQAVGSDGQACRDSQTTERTVAPPAQPEAAIPTYPPSVV